VSLLLGAALWYGHEYGCVPVLHHLFSSFSSFFCYRRSQYGQIIRAWLPVWMVVKFSGNFSRSFVAERWPVRASDTGASCPYGRSLKSLVSFVNFLHFPAISRRWYERMIHGHPLNSLELFLFLWLRSRVHTKRRGIPKQLIPSETFIRIWNISPKSKTKDTHIFVEKF
jgi:hypothetical protein